MAKDYTPEFQKLLLELMIHNHGLFARIQNIYKKPVKIIERSAIVFLMLIKLIEEYNIRQY